MITTLSNWYKGLKMNPLNSRVAHFFGHHTYKKNVVSGKLSCKYCSKVHETDKKIADNITLVVEQMPVSIPLVQSEKSKEDSHG
jgi:hypothetical protein